MKLILLLFLSLSGIVSSASTVAAQENCNLENSPRLLGLKLQMRPEEVQNVFGKDLKIKVKKNDQKSIFQNYIEEPAPPSLAGVRALYLRFIDRRLYQIEVFFEESGAVRSLGDFTNLLSAKFNFPTSIWQPVKGKAVVNCGEATLVADKVLNPHLEITDETARAKVEAIRLEQSKKD